MKNNQKVLIIDDDKNSLQILGNFLRDEFEISCAQTGIQGIRKAELYQPDLILLDLLMPYMSGLDTLSQLKKISATKHIPILILYSDTYRKEAYLAIEKGAYDCIRKPFDYLVIETRVKNALNPPAKFNIEESKITIP
ncbi:response regulatory protein (rrp-1) [Marinomonas sp. MED121]|uniref:response regulator n=1 Tax=Marinomonas sp. MED121 TaxID=314277 RepID=UPI00006911A3|nr:response regulator [Marinomonas sp. MED121]EAQ67277.1 response regulatory protein (rrp-1) [Marinomonas sp. MED121]